jgi:hypothetical protein
MSKQYHSILLDTEFKDKDFVKKWKELGRKHSRQNNWWQIKVEVDEDKLDDMIKQGQELLASNKYYFHIYTNDKLIVVFPFKVFNLKTDRSDWKEMIDYGKNLGIPEDQLDIKPVKFEEETY